ncbi:hypothetical protein ACMUMQ_06975 [Marinomonas sp. 2405UD66-6]|uniref:hypothetical protein n=1 Tax=Marinomonas sp. 2405UD66-6 TaxID=3391834 RepID=UPI0039C99521
MKLKEYIPSFINIIKLRSLPLEKLKSTNAPTLPVIVTLTSIPSRLHIIDITIRSILSQPQKPQKIVLWLHEELQNQLPKKLTDLVGEIFEIRFQKELTCSHRKLIYSLKEFLDTALITCDDDLIYRPEWLASLYNDHQTYPNSVIANECRMITYDESGELLPYKQWTYLKTPGVVDKKLLPIGYGGVLYPKNALHEDATNPDLFLKLAPKADDLWFKMMSLLKGTEVRRSSHPCQKPIPIAGSQAISLKKTNIREDKNRLQWLALCEYYDIKP